jgi:hypothetical protein
LALNYARTFGNHNITGLALLNREQKIVKHNLHILMKPLWEG